MRKKFLIKPFLQIRQLLWTLSVAVMCFVIGYIIFESVLAKHLTHDAITAQNWPVLQHQLRLGFMLGLAILLCLIGIESYFFFHSIAGPIYALERGLRRIAQGDFNDVTRIRETDQLSELIVAFEDVKRVVQRRMETQEKMAQSLTQELDQLLTGVSTGNIDDIRDRLKEIRNQVEKKAA